MLKNTMRSGTTNGRSSRASPHFHLPGSPTARCSHVTRLQPVRCMQRADGHFWEVCLTGKAVPFCALVFFSSHGLERRYVGWRLSRHREPVGDTVRMGERESRLLSQRKTLPTSTGGKTGVGKS